MTRWVMILVVVIAGCGGEMALAPYCDAETGPALCAGGVVVCDTEAAPPSAWCYRDDLVTGPMLAPAGPTATCARGAPACPDGRVLRCVPCFDGLAEDLPMCDTAMGTRPAEGC